MSNGNMGSGNGPVRRRRIAGEPAPATDATEPKRRIVPKPVKKAPVVKEPAKKAKAPKIPVARGHVTPPPTPAADPSATDSAAHNAAPPITLAKPAAPSKPSAPIVPAAEDRPDRRKFIPLAALALAAVVFGAFFAVKGIGDYNDQRGIGDGNAAASAAAGRAAETIFSYDYTTLPEHATKSKALMTPSFKKQFDTIDSQLTTLATQTKAVILSQARNAAALPCGSECSPDKASILVFIDQAKQNVDLKTPTVYANRMVVDMVKRDGVWLVNDIQAL